MSLQLFWHGAVILTLFATFKKTRDKYLSEVIYLYMFLPGNRKMHYVNFDTPSNVMISYRNFYVSNKRKKKCIWVEIQV